MVKADAKAQKSYLRELPKYRVMATLANCGAEWQSGEGYYLKGPEFEYDVGRDELQLRIEHTAYPEEFRFDEENGRLFRDEVDEYDYMYYAHVGSPTAPPWGGRVPLSWERSRMVMERRSYRFKGAFRAIREGSEIFLSWMFCRQGGWKRWDTKDILSVSDFALEHCGQDYKLSMITPGSDDGIIYRLKLIPVAMGIW